MPTGESDKPSGDSDECRPGESSRWCRWGLGSRVAVRYGHGIALRQRLPALAGASAGAGDCDRLRIPRAPPVRTASSWARTASAHRIRQWASAIGQDSHGRPAADRDLPDDRLGPLGNRSRRLMSCIAMCHGAVSVPSAGPRPAGFGLVCSLPAVSSLTAPLRRWSLPPGQTTGGPRSIRYEACSEAGIS